MMIPKIKAYREIFKLGIGARRVTGQIHEFYRAHSINSLKKEGLFDFLSIPQRLEDIADHFGYTDLDYLKDYLEAYTADGILQKEDNKYKMIGSTEDYPIILPNLWGPGLAEQTQAAAESLPNRLKGHYTSFSDDMGTFDWDNALHLRMYEVIRNAAFIYTDAAKRRGTFIDIGCGSGVESAAIWGYYYKEGAFNSGNPVKMYALEYDENLLRIAEEEFPIYASRLLGVDREVVDDLSDHHPTFIHGSAEDLPFEDEFFDTVFNSQILHWCDAKKATTDMIRILKPGGLLFGTEGFHPHLDKYMDLYVRLNEGAHGAVNKEDFFKWALDAGASSADAATPAGLFKIIK